MYLGWPPGHNLTRASWAKEVSKQTDGHTRSLPVPSSVGRCRADTGATRATLTGPGSAHRPLLPSGTVTSSSSPPPDSLAWTFPRIMGVGWSGVHPFPSLEGSIKSWGEGGDGEMEAHLSLSDLSPVPAEGTAGDRTLARGRLR